MALARHYCSSPMQDQLHGPGIRVTNPVNKTRQGGCASKKPPREYRCTVCGEKIDASQLYVDRRSIYVPSANTEGK